MPKRYVVVVQCRVAVEIDDEVLIDGEKVTPFARACEATAAVLPDGWNGTTIDQTLISEVEHPVEGEFDAWADSLI